MFLLRIKMVHSNLNFESNDNFDERYRKKFPVRLTFLQFVRKSGSIGTLKYFAISSIF